MCDSHNIELRNDRVATYKYLGKIHTINSQEYALCLDCGTRFYADGQIERNNERFRALEKRVVKDISPSDVLRIRQKYGLSQEQAALVFNSGKNMFSKWERGTSAPTGTAALILQLALVDSTIMDKLARRAGITIGRDETTYPSLVVGTTDSVRIMSDRARARLTPPLSRYHLVQNYEIMGSPDSVLAHTARAMHESAARFSGTWDEERFEDDNDEDDDIDDRLSREAHFGHISRSATQ